MNKIIDLRKIPVKPRKSLLDNLELKATEKGFTVWHKGNGTWLLDASCLKEDGVIRIAQDFAIPKGVKIIIDKSNISLR